MSVVDMWTIMSDSEKVTCCRPTACTCTAPWLRISLSHPLALLALRVRRLRTTDTLHRPSHAPLTFIVSCLSRSIVQQRVMLKHQTSRPRSMKLRNVNATFSLSVHSSCACALLRHPRDGQFLVFRASLQAHKV